MTDSQIIILGNVITLIFLLIAYGTAFLYVMCGGKFYRGVLWGWNLSYILMFILSLIGQSLWKSHPEQIEIIKSVFPDNIIAVPFFVFGWIPALGAAGLALLVKRLIRKFENRRRRSCVEMT